MPVRKYLKESIKLGDQELTVEAALTGKREHVYQAAMLDPHTAAELDPEQICALVDDLLEDSKKLLLLPFAMQAK